jgi:hypothetical protein
MEGPITPSSEDGFSPRGENDFSSADILSPIREESGFDGDNATVATDDMRRRGSVATDSGLTADGRSDHGKSDYTTSFKKFVYKISKKGEKSSDEIYRKLNKESYDNLTLSQLYNTLRKIHHYDFDKMTEDDCKDIFKSIDPKSESETEISYEAFHTYFLQLQDSYKGESTEVVKRFRQTTKVRNTLKKEINDWMADFEAKNGRKPTKEDKLVIAQKFHALKEVLPNNMLFDS